MKIRKAFTLLTPCILVWACVSGGVPSDPPGPELVAAFSGGVIERMGPVTVEFTRDFDSSVPAGVFRLEPSAKGTVSWKNSYTLEFYPARPLKAGQTYTARVDPSKLTPLAGGTAAAAETDSGEPGLVFPELKPFAFTFTAAVPTLELGLDPLKVDGEGMALVSGYVLTEKGAELAKIEKTVSSRELGKISWSHENGEHRFSFKPVAREEESREVTINFDGSPVGAGEKGVLTTLIPGTRFEVLEIRFENGVLCVVFSSPLDPNQDLRGFISLSGNTAIRYSIDGNQVQIYGSEGENIAEGALLVIQDLSDAYGNVLAEPVQYTVPGKWELPEARFTGRGTILPTSQGSTTVIETKNLSGILVEAFRIYGDNMIQFLQVNSMEGTRELERVGEPVWTNAFDFTWKDTDKNTWVRRGLDLSGLARKYPGEMFHIRLSFRPRHIKYECREGHEDFSGMEFPGDSFQPFGNSSSSENSYWDYWEDNYDYDWYQHRMDPCHPAFYLRFYDHSITVGRSALVSDLGLMAKRGLDGSWIVAASNLKTARGEGGVSIDVLNYQGRSLFKLKTDGSGLVSFGGTPVAEAGPGNQTPAFLAASGGPGRAWLRIGDGQSLAVSHFDIAGEKPASGLRGLIYGERGVWRPGDDIFLTFLLADPEKTLPANHPVSFELEDPRGRIGSRRTFTSSVDGFYPIAVSTQADAPTGDWTARVSVGGSVFTRNLKIETVIPNRLRMDLDFGPKPYVERKNPAVIEAAWLYGAPASGLNADISVIFSEKSGVFPGNGDYSFSDPSRSVSGERQQVWQGKLDGQGQARFNLDMDPGGAVPGKLNARFMTRVFEPSGAFSSEQFTREFSPYTRYVGLRTPKGDAARNMLLTDTVHRADLLVLDADGKPVPGRVNLDCAIYKLEWRWWWEKGGYEAAEFASALSRNPVGQETVSVQNGRGSLEFQVKYPDWGRYLIVARDGEGHSAAGTVYVDWPGWAGRAMEGDGQGAAAMLALSPGKQQYNSGEKIAVSFPSNKDAGALVVVEKGGTVLRKEWVRCQDTQTTYEFTAEPSMVPNVYVHVSLIQPHLQTQNDLPLRLYGITPVTIDDPRTRLSPVVAAGETWEPESEASFTVSEASGRPMVYTVAVVDEGLLGLTRYSLPSPGGTFYAREASFLKSWDLFADVMGAYSGQLETLLAIGGGDDESAEGNKASQRFKPVVRFFGPYELAAGEKKTERFTLPPYIGALRVMVLAASSTRENGAANRAYGTAEKQVKVSSDLMVFGTVPRVLSPNDEAVIPVSVASYREGRRSVEVNMAVSGAALQGSARETVSFDKTGEKTVLFKIKAPPAPGIVRFTINASSAQLKTARHVTDLAVRSTALPVSATRLKLLSPNENWTGTIDYPGMAGTNTAIMEFSRLPPLNLEGRLENLIRYPHGCVEQTTSAAFPQLYLDKVMELNAAKTGELRANIRAAIERLASFQVPGGGFAYWPGGESADDWGSTYAGHFLIEAKRAGYAVPADLLSGFIGFQKGRAAGWASREGNQAEQAYRLFTLALAGEADFGSMNRLRERRELVPLARWRLAAAYWYSGQRDAARNLVTGQSTAVADYREYGGTFGSAFRDRAVILETLILLGNSEADTKALFEETAAALASDTWFSTQETAAALRSAIAFMQGASGQAREMNVDFSFAGSRNSAAFSSQVMQSPLGSPSGVSGNFSVTNNSSAPLYARVSVRGLPEEGREQALSRGLSLAVEYRSASGAPVDPDTVSPGQDMTVQVTVSNTRPVAVENIAVVHQFPASWEIINDRLGAEGGAAGSIDYQDIRDDRVMSYFSLESGASKTVSVRVNKTYAGTYFRPAVHAYAMYDESVAAVVPGVRRQ